MWRSERLACIGPMMVDKHVPPRGKHCLLIFGSPPRQSVEFEMCLVLPGLAVLHRAVSPVATLMRIGSGCPSVFSFESELRAIARGVSCEEGEEGDEGDTPSDAGVPDLSML